MIEEFKKKIPATPAEVAGLFLLLLCFLAAFWGSQYGSNDRPFPQWDKVVHTVAGASLAIIFWPHVKGRRLILLVFCIGFIFELVEFFIAPPLFYGGTELYIRDTLLDLIVDTLGAWIVVQAYQRYGK